MSAKNTLETMKWQSVAVLSVALAIGGASEAWPAGDPLKIVQIGDSYSAGNGARDANGKRNYVGPKGCYRSPTNWASQYVEWLRDEGLNVTFVNRACSGGVIPDYTNRRHMGDQIVFVLEPPDVPPADIEALALADQCRTRYPGDEVYEAEYQYYDTTFGHVVRCDRFMEPQINAIGEDTDLVLITGGGNDVNFGNIVLECFVPGPGALGRDPGSCRSNVENAFDNIGVIEDRLFNLLGQVRAAARPDTKVALLGYPYLANNDDFELVFKRLGFFWESDRYAASKEVRRLGRAGDVRQQEAMDRANAAADEPFATYVRFVPEVKEHFIGHEPKPEVGTGNPDRWMTELEGRIKEEYYHYNAEGHRQLGLLLRQFDTFGAEGDDTGTSASIDLAFVIDTTGSMGGDIAAVKASANAIIDALELGAQSYRVAVVDYRDFPERTGFAGDYSAQLQLDFSSEPDEIRAAINGLSLGFGGDFPETMWSGLMTAFSLDWRPGVKKVALQFGDAPALNPEPFTGFTTLEVILTSLFIDPVAVYAIDTGSAGAEIREVAEATGGEVLVAPTPAQVADKIQEVLNSAFSSPYAWVGTGYASRIGDPISFDASGSYDADGDIVSYEWDMDGDGVFETSTPVPDFEFIYPGAYDGLVTLRVTDDAGLIGLATAPVDVSVDGDGIDAANDNCPEIHNPGQEDQDDDGVGDLCDPDFVVPTEDEEGVSFAVGPPPVATVLTGPYQGVVGQAIAISGEVSDPEGDVVTPLWFVLAGCAVADPGALATTVTCDTEGTHPLWLTADDGNGGIVADETSVTVTEPDFVFGGFDPPVRAPQTTSANAGRAIPIKWSLTDRDGLPVNDPASFVAMIYQPASCDTGAAIGGPVVAESGRGLQSRGGGRWNYVWKTPKSLAGECVLVSLELTDPIVAERQFLVDFGAQ